jgi:hypothetical protein
MATQPGPGGGSSNRLRATVVPAKARATATATKAKAKAQPLTVKQQAIQQVNAVNQASMATTERAAQKAVLDARAQAQQALGFQTAFADISQGDAGRIYDAYANAAAKTSAYGNLALASTGDSSRSAAEQAQNYLGTVGPDVGAETRPDISGALRALGATAVGDPASALAAQGGYAQERSRDVRNAQLMRLADIGANAMYQGTQTANELRADEVARASGSRAADVNAAITALREEKRAGNVEGRAARLATNTERRARAEESRAVIDQRMENRAFEIEIQQKRVDVAATRLANATGEIEQKQAQFELDNAQKVLDASLKQQAAETANTKADTAATKKATKLGAKGLTAYERAGIIQKAHDAAAKWHDPPPDSNILTPDKPPKDYGDGVNILMRKYGMSRAQAVDVMDSYYTEPGVDGRPVFDLREMAQLGKLGFTKAQIQQAMTGYVKAKQSGKPTSGYRLYEKMLDRLAGNPAPRTMLGRGGQLATAVKAATR